jgi:hypothetical protein
VQVKTGSLPVYTLEGLVVFSACGTGGLYVLGYEWDILSVHVNDLIDLKIDTDFKGHSRLSFSQHVDVGFRVCVGCACVGGDVGFGMSLGIGDEPPGGTAAFATVLERGRSVGHALLDAIAA